MKSASLNKLCYIAGVLLLLFLMLFFAADKAYADTPKFEYVDTSTTWYDFGAQGGRTSSDYRVEGGDKYFWCVEDEMQYNLYVSDSKTGKGKRIIKSNGSESSFNPGILTNGETIYYVMSSFDGTSWKSAIYQCDINGKNRKKLKNIDSEFVYLVNVYNNQIYFTASDINYIRREGSMFSLSLKTLKVFKRVEGMDGASSTGSSRYIIGYNGLDRQVYDCKEKKVIYTFDEYIDEPFIRGSYLYYKKHPIKEDGEITIMYRSKISELGKKAAEKICTMDTTIRRIGYYSSSVVYYRYGLEYYKYYVKTGKTVKITQSKFKFN